MAQKIMAESMHSHAVMVYTGRGRFPMPWGFAEAVRSLDVPEAEELARYAQGINDEMYSLFPLDWGHDLPGDKAARMVESAMAKRHPELNAEAVAALAWMWSYSSWK